MSIWTTFGIAIVVFVIAVVFIVASPLWLSIAIWSRRKAISSGRAA